MKLTDEQRAAVHAEGDSVAVVAGAGTGKTRVLTERYLHLVLDRDVDMRRILAVTFTKKAAREMKERIRDALAERGEAERARQVEFAPISTIHTFLARVLRERALDAGVDPRFAIADEITADLLLDQALADAVDAADEQTRAALVDVAGAEDFLRRLYLAARATPHELAQLAPVAFNEAAFRERLAWFLDDIAACAATGKTAEKITRLGALRSALLDFDPEAIAEFPALIARWGGAAKDLAPEAKAIKAEFEGLAHRERSEKSGAAIVRLMVDLDARFAAFKRDDGLLDFADLERVGLRLLRSAAGEEVAREYDHLLVDEYQDTSRIQEALLDALATRCARFGVGDAKQSIYRFRYADASIFADLQKSAECHPLSGSFRSRPEVVEFVNGLFRVLFKGTGVEPQDLRAARTDWEEQEFAAVELLSPVGRNAFAARRREAEALAARLRELVHGQGRFRFGECAILLPRMSNLALYERALADAGVPYVVVKGRGYFAAREVVDLAHLLLTLEDPHDDYRAIGAMTSLLGGIPETDLVRLTGDAPWPLRARTCDRPAQIPEDRWARLVVFAERFERWRGILGRVDAGTLVETILDETRFADLLLLEPDGRRRHANLKKALRQARGTTASPGEFARELLEFREREVRESEAPVASEDDDAVQIMTVHASKGLEFPCVFVADLSESSGRVRGAILRPDGMFGFKLRGEKGKSIEPPGLGALKAWEQEQEEAERRRLWYVALTRAEKHLVVSWPRAGTRTGNKALDPLLATPPNTARVLDPDGLRAPGRRRGLAASVRAALRRGAELPPEVERDEAAAQHVLQRVDSFRPPQPDQSPYIAAVADLVEFDRCPRRYRLKRMFGIEIDDAPQWTNPGEDRPDDDEHPRRLLGTVFHKVIAEIGPGHVPTEAQVLSHFPEAKEGDVAKIIGWSEWLSEQPIAARLRECKTVAEMDFLVRLGGLPVRGSIDLYTRDLPLLLDYKTSRRAKPQQYALQVAVYLGALRALDLPCPDTAHLVYVDAEEVHEVEPVALDALMDAFGEAHREEPARGFAPNPGDACEYCEFRLACEENGVRLPSPSAS
ncbi:MAG: UvrD-helicase domain-containing protein [Planctomycetota bacterium]